MAGLLNKIIDLVKGNTPVAGDGISVSRQSGIGSIISVDKEDPTDEDSGGGSATSPIVVPVKITGIHDNSPAVDGTKEVIFVGDVYGNGKSDDIADVTESDVTIRILQIANGKNVPVGAMFLATMVLDDTWDAETAP